MISQWNMSVLSITVICITLVHLSVGVRRGKAGARTKAPAAGPSFDTFSSLITLLDLSPLSHLARLLFNDNLISANMPRSNGGTLARMKMASSMAKCVRRSSSRSPFSSFDFQPRRAPSPSNISKKMFKNSSASMLKCKNV